MLHDPLQPLVYGQNADLTVPVETLPLTEAATAHRRIESGSTTGKLVLAVAR